MTSKSSGFTLIELLVVVAILGIIAGIGIVSYQGYVTSAKIKSAKNVLMQTGLGQMEYFSDYNKYYTDDLCTLDNADTTATGYGSNTTSDKMNKLLLGGSKNFNSELGFYGCAGSDSDGWVVFAVEDAGECVIKMNSKNVFEESDEC